MSVALPNFSPAGAKRTQKVFVRPPSSAGRAQVTTIEEREFSSKVTFPVLVGGAEVNVNK